jgi:8-oxo-dGTP pyrophosphatase MutT (NUDIX family)
MMVGAYRRHGVCDIRWNGYDCETHWNLDLPQAAAMTVIRRDNNVLLLRRPADDYLYPNQWTIPGGYLQSGERPSDAAARELLEETGLRLLPEPLFGGVPVVSDRLAAFAYEFRLPDGDDPMRLTEHDASEFVPMDRALDMDLTPEARLIFDRYHALTGTANRKP